MVDIAPIPTSLRAWHHSGLCDSVLRASHTVDVDHGAYASLAHGAAYKQIFSSR